MAMIRIYRINTGSCGGCDEEIQAVIATSADMEWAHTPHDADLLVLTGPITQRSKPPLQRILREAAHTPLIVIGRCAIDGHPFGKGGVREIGEIEEVGAIAVQHEVDGCPPDPEMIATAIREQVT